MGSKYKEDYRVSFPPFKFLVDFVHQQAKMRNDPSFSLTTIQKESRRPNKPAFPRAVMTHKTQEVHKVSEDEPVESEVSSACTEVCGGNQLPRSCSKVCLVKVFPEDQPEKAVKTYVILDDQSNRSLARSEFFNLFGITECNVAYTLKTCAGTVETEDRLPRGFQVESLDGSIVLPLPVLLECNEIPDKRSEIPTLEIISKHRHLKHIVKYIPEPDHHAPILLLLGRDIIRVHKAHKQVNGPSDAPFAHKSDLGWVVVGDMCLGKVHKPTFVGAYRTSILENGQRTYFQPCPNYYHMKERSQYVSCIRSLIRESTPKLTEWDIFQTTKDDEERAFSIEDQLFLQIMDRDVNKDEENSWVAPLPFKQPRRYLPNNCSQAVERLNSLLRAFSRKPEMKEDFIGFMEKLFQNDHAEIAPAISPSEQCWYLPSFGVYHPKKPSQIRVVFDSSAPCKGISLNQVLLSGPDLNNNLL